MSISEQHASDLLSVLDEPINQFTYFTPKRGAGPAAEAAAKRAEQRRAERRARKG